MLAEWTESTQNLTGINKTLVLGCNFPLIATYPARRGCCTPVESKWTREAKVWISHFLCNLSAIWANRRKSTASQLVEMGGFALLQPNFVISTDSWIFPQKNIAWCSFRPILNLYGCYSMSCQTDVRCVKIGSEDETNYSCEYVFIHISLSWWLFAFRRPLTQVQSWPSFWFTTPDVIVVEIPHTAARMLRCSWTLCCHPRSRYQVFLAL